MAAELGDYFTYPYKASLKTIKAAEMASTSSSQQLIKDDEPDAYYFRGLESKQISLNEAQIKAVRHYKGPCLVIAGAGSGKTRVLTSRVGHLVSFRKVHPKQIMVLTFTKKAAEEMRERILMLPGITKDKAYAVTAGTFHSIFLKLIRAHGYTQRILSQDSRKHTALKIIMRKMELQDPYEPEQLTAILSALKGNMTTVYDFEPSSEIEKEIKRILIQYEEWKHENDLMDFDDILLNAYHLLLEKPKLLAQMQRRFQFLLCDEWQDTNPIQAELVRMIADPYQNLFVVGDDDQTIYSFNGADSRIILNFDEQYSKSKIVTLDVNYRSTPHILGLANAVIKHNESRKIKTLKASVQGSFKPLFSRPRDTDHEAAVVIQKIQEKINAAEWQYGDITILYRTISSCRAMTEQLVEFGIPFQLHAEYSSFYQQPIVKQVIDYLRLSLNPRNYEAIANILPTLFIARDKGMAFIEERELGAPSDEPLSHLKELPGLKDFHRQQVEERIELIRCLNREHPTKAVKIIRGVYDKYVEADERKTVTMHKDLILETLSEIEASANNHQTVTEFVHFIDRINEKLDQNKTRTEDANREVNVMSIHKSKGLEFPVVFLIGASETILPHSSALDADNRKDLTHHEHASEKTTAAMEEERRLMYVAITRAKQEVHISSPIQYRGKNVEVSRFLMEAFTDRTTNPSGTTKSRTKPLEKALVWTCVNVKCNAWKRVATYEETLLAKRECPVCSSEMLKTTKEL